MPTKINIKLVTSKHGYDDFDVAGHPLHIYRACVPRNIKKNETFNVYLGQSRKLSAAWQGSLKISLEKFTTTEQGT